MRIWQSGDAMDCKSIYLGSIPSILSKFKGDIMKEKNDVISDMKSVFKTKTYPHWVTASDDQMNKVLKTCIYLI